MEGDEATYSERSDMAEVIIRWEDTGSRNFCRRVSTWVKVCGCKSYIPRLHISKKIFGSWGALFSNKGGSNET